MKFFKLWILYYKHFLKDFIATKSSYHIYLNGFFLKRNYFKTFSREIRFLTGTGIQKLMQYFNFYVKSQSRLKFERFEPSKT